MRTGMIRTLLTALAILLAGAMYLVLIAPYLGS